MSKIKYVDVKKEDGIYVYSTNPVDEFTNRIADEKLVTFNFLQRVIGNLSGQFFTIIDATVVDREQKKAVKDLIRGVVSKEYEVISDFVYDQEKMSKLATESFEEAESRGEVIEGVDLVDMLINN
jgi:predicted kinase